VYATGNGSLRGLMIDRNGHLWAAGNAPCSLVQFDVTTRSLINGAVPLPGCDTPVGVSIDVDGFVWSPDQWANVAFKVDPSTYTITTAAGLVQPYTYSDMTGAGLDLVVNPPVE
jgi:streptogramin lyase